MTIITIHDHEVDSDTHNLYDVTIDSSATVHTLVTSSSAAVDSWLSQTPLPAAGAVVGLDIEWRPNFGRQFDNPAATIQLCPSPDRCLVFQLIHADAIPASLRSFLDAADRRFVGVGIAHDVEKLLCDYGLGVRNAVDLGAAAATEYGEARLRNAGLKELARRVVGIEIEKPKRITMGRWDYRWLNADQVKYACVDAYASHAIGSRLINSSGDGSN